MPATDVIDLDTALTAINMTGSGAAQSEQVALFVSAVSDLLDDLCGPIVARTVTETINTTGYTVRLTQWPILSITDITDAGVTLTAGTSFTESSGLLTRLSGSLLVCWTGPIVVTYEAGRYATTEDVGAKFKLAAQEIIAREWPQYAAAWSRGGGVFGAPEGSLGYFKSVQPVLEQWLAHDRRPPAVA